MVVLSQEASSVFRLRLSSCEAASGKPLPPNQLTPPLAEAEQAVADADGVAAAEGARAIEALAIDIGSRGRAHVGQHVGIALARQAGMDALDAVVPCQANVAALRVPQGDDRLGENQLAAGAGAGLD